MLVYDDTNPLAHSVFSHIDIDEKILKKELLRSGYKDSWLCKYLLVNYDVQVREIGAVH